MVDAGIDPIPEGGIVVGAIDGLNTRASMPPINARSDPIPKPQRAGRAIMDMTRTITTHIVWDCGFWYIITAPTRTINPKVTPTIPNIAPIPPKKNDKPTVTAMPPISRSIPPINDRTNAAVGFSPKLFP